MDKHSINWKQLVRYLNGEQSAEEQQRTDNWISADPEHERFMYFLKKIWNTPAEEKQEWDVDAAWFRYKALYKEPVDMEKADHAARPRPVTQNRQQVRPGRISWLYRLGGVAATLALTLLMIFLVYEPEPEPRTPVREFVTRYGERTHVRLSDGSLAIINAGSRLSVPEVFPDSVRKVQLSGEAYFEVVPDPGRPFIVHTENAVTHVLGTKFGVNTYYEDGRVVVVVVEGKVAIRSTEVPGKPGKQITKKQMGVVTKTGNTTVTQIRDVAPYLGWTRGDLVFAYNSLEQVITKLERWYDIKIKLRDPELAGRTFTGSFTARQPLEEVLDAIALALGLEYEKQATVIYFNKKKGNNGE